MAEAFTPTLKRTRTSKSPNSDSETNSPDDKRIFISSFSTTLFKNDISPNGKPLDVSDDQVLAALTYVSSVFPKKVKVARIHVKWCTSFWRTN